MKTLYEIIFTCFLNAFIYLVVICLSKITGLYNSGWNLFVITGSVVIGFGISRALFKFLNAKE